MVYLYQSIGVSDVAQLSSRLSTKQPSKRGKSYRCKVWMSPIEVGKIIPVRQSVSSAPSRQVSPSRRLISPCLGRRKISKCWGNRGLRACINVNCMYWEETCRHFGWFCGRGRRNIFQDLKTAMLKARMNELKGTKFHDILPLMLKRQNFTSRARN